MRPVGAGVYRSAVAALLAATLWLCPGPTRASLIFSRPSAQAQGGGDDTTTDITLPFNFTFYGTSRTTLRLSSNGAYDPTDAMGGTHYDNGRWPNSSYPVIAPFWDDLSTTPGNGTYTGIASVAGVTYSGVFVIAVPAAMSYGYANAATTLAFQVALFATNRTIGLANGQVFSFQSNDIAFCYASNALKAFAGGHAAAGISDGSGAAGHYTGIPGSTAGDLTDVTLFPTNDGQFVLFRPDGTGTNYTAAITNFIDAPMLVAAGNGLGISDGDGTPSTSDGTDFGALNVAAGTRDRTFTVTNGGPVTLNLTGTPSVSVAGAHAADFTVTAQPAASLASGGAATTFTVRFNPSADGLRSATVSIGSDDPLRNPFDFAIQGEGFTPIATLVADYRFNGDLRSSVTGAPDLVFPGYMSSQSAGSTPLDLSVNGIATFGITTGFELVTSNILGIAHCTNYTVAMRVKMADTGAWIPMAYGSPNTYNADDGFYIQDGKLSLWYNGNHGLGSSGAIPDNTWTQLVYSVRQNGADPTKVDLFGMIGNGSSAVQATFTAITPSTSGAYALRGNDPRIEFFRGYYGVSNATGSVDRIQVYVGAMSTNEAAALDLSIEFTAPVGTVFIIR